jgi:hypothetical protein
MEYACPMHREVRQPAPGKCPKCNMALMPQGIRFALLRHMVGKPWHLALMVAAMLALMVLAMLLIHS